MLGLEGDEYWVLATGLGGGLGRQLTCGNITGGALAIGLAIARRKGLDHDDRIALWRETIAEVAELTRQFEARFGALDCRALVGRDLDFATTEWVRPYGESGALERVCVPAARFVVEAAAGLVLEGTSTSTA